MRIDRVKLIAEMARQNVSINELSEKACISPLHTVRLTWWQKLYGEHC